MMVELAPRDAVGVSARLHPDPATNGDEPMLGLLWMINPLWEGVITPMLLIGFGWWVRPRVEHLERQAHRPYDWEIDG